MTGAERVHHGSALPTLIPKALRRGELLPRSKLGPALQQGTHLGWALGAPAGLKRGGFSPSCLPRDTSLECTMFAQVLPLAPGHCVFVVLGVGIRERFAGANWLRVFVLSLLRASCCSCAGVEGAAK